MKKLILCLLVVGLQANAFTINYGGGSVYKAWNSNKVTFDYDFSACPAAVSVSDLKAAVQASLDIWNGVPSSSLSVVLGSSISKTAAAVVAQSTAGNPVIVCDPNFSTTLSVDGNYVPAAAAILATDTNHHITFAGLFLNAEVGKSDNIQNMDLTLMSVIMAHEIGHSLGLGHSSDTHALMYYDASAKTQLSLAKDDIEGISYLYPRNELSGSGIFGCNTIKNISPPNSGGLMMEFGLLLALFWVGSRSKMANRVSLWENI